MIKQIFCSDGNLDISVSPAPYISASTDAGAIRWNPNIQGLEVYSGYSWVPISDQTVSVGLNSDSKAALDWAKKKMNHEKETNLLASMNRSVQDALAQLTKAQEQLDIIVALVKNGSKENV